MYVKMNVMQNKMSFIHGQKHIIINDINNGEADINKGSLTNYYKENDNDRNTDKDKMNTVEYIKDDNAIAEEEIIVNDLLSHVLIINESINEMTGQITQTFYCQQCETEFSNAESFIYIHSEGILTSNSNEIVTATTANLQPLGKVVQYLENGISHTNQEEINIDENIEEERLQNDRDLQAEYYFCCDCQKVFMDALEAEQHVCSTEPKKKSDLIELNYGDTSYICLYCQQYFADNDELIYHISKCELRTENRAEDSEPLVNAFQCKVCYKSLNTLQAFQNHICLKETFAVRKKLLTKSLLINAVQTTCNICKTIFSSHKNLKLHMKMHKKPSIKSIQDALPASVQSEYADMDQFYCEICNKSFDKNLLTIHKNMHQNVEKYNCVTCNRKFEDSLNYEMHLQMHLENLNAPTDGILRQGNRNKEMKLNNNNNINNKGRKKFPCQYCGREFRRPYEKVKHERIHTGEKPYECEVCGKTFRVQYSLTLHLRTHTDIRPYICPNCNKRFKSYSVYAHHINIHTDQRLYKCDICNKSFHTSVQLCGHKNSHKKPYLCTQCNRPFASLYAVKVHMKTHNISDESTKILQKDCSICGATYTRIFALRYHLKEQHGIDMDAMNYSGTVPSGNHEIDDNFGDPLDAGIIVMCE